METLVLNAADVTTLDMIHQCDEQITQYEEAIATLRAQRADLIRVAKEDGTTETDRWRLVTPTKSRRSVNVGVFRDRYPDMFEELATVTASQAEKLIGKEQLREIARRLAPEDYKKTAGVTMASVEGRFGKGRLPPEIVEMRVDEGDPVLERVV